ncbi:MAG TPA: hypothetical protein GXX19_09000 [Syntrophomonadaceae bacterium]|nr:hypothetical protein [Syntrophomonadaceae bacterium]
MAFGLVGNESMKEYHEKMKVYLEERVRTRTLPSGKPMTDDQLRRAQRRLAELTAYVERGI